MDAGVAHDAGGPQNPATSLIVDASRPDVADAFFINDPAPPICGPDGGMSKPAPISGTADCPADKNRQGCPCTTVGMQAACWPGKRQNRNHGSCVDGTTTCGSTAEFGALWGPCKGYVLPKEGATEGADACRCFSNGKWAISNVVPCVYSDASVTYLYSSHPDAQHGFACDSVSTLPPPLPAADWSPSTLNVECAGQFKLCYALRAGHASEPKPDDCILVRSCIDVWYAHAGQSQVLPNLPGWTTTDAACAKRFSESGGYGEMSVIGISVECDPVNDGAGNATVFARAAYCTASCANTPNAANCTGCAVSGSGMF
jgi:hypothetical protein